MMPNVICLASLFLFIAFLYIPFGCSFVLIHPGCVCVLGSFVPSVAETGPLYIYL